MNPPGSPDQTATDHRPAVAARRRERMQDRLVSAAIRVASRQGQTHLTIDDVVAEAAVARGTFYRYFSSTDELLGDIAHTASAEVVALLNPLVQQQSNPVDQMATGLNGALTVIRRTSALAHLITSAGWPRRTFAAEHPIRTMLGANLSAGIAAGAFAVDDATALDIVLAFVVLGAQRQLQHRPVQADADDGAPVSSITAACLRALGVTPAAARRASERVVDVPTAPEGSLLHSLGAL